jgi:nucleotide-binding universal stress UspA family protein
VCPIDFSDCSRRALQYAAALASHFGAALGVIHVADPMLAGAAAIHQFNLLGDEARAELRAFVEAEIPLSPSSDLTIVQGAAHREILKYAARKRADLIVVGTHGLTGVRKAFFGSTTRSVLRRASIPVLAVPLPEATTAHLQRPLIARGPVLAPVDFSAESEAAARVAAGLARALSVPLLLLHVARRGARGIGSWQQAGIPGDRTPVLEIRALAQKLAAAVGRQPIEPCVTEGAPAEEIARCARDNNVSVIVMALNGAGRGARPGSVAYRVLCLAPAPVLAVPPEAVSGRRALGAEESSRQSAAFARVGAF